MEGISNYIIVPYSEKVYRNDNSSGRARRIDDLGQRSPITIRIACVSVFFSSHVCGCVFSLVGLPPSVAYARSWSGRLLTNCDIVAQE